jgi:hypothetical protein
MRSSRLMVRASLIALAFGLLQGCAGPRQKSPEVSLSEEVVQQLYTRRMYITGSRIARSVDVRKSLETTGAQPLKVVKYE